MVKKEPPKDAKPLALLAIAILVALLLGFIWQGWDWRYIATAVVWAPVTVGLSMRAWPQ